MKYLCMIAFTLILAGCGDPYYKSTQAYKRSIYTWLGRPVSELEAAWGQPQSVAKWDRDLKAYTWSFPLDSGQDNVYKDKKSGKERRYDVCVATIVVDSGGRISNFNPTPEDTDEALGCGFLKTPPPDRAGKNR